MESRNKIAGTDFYYGPNETQRGGNAFIYDCVGNFLYGRVKISSYLGDGWRPAYWRKETGKCIYPYPGSGRFDLVRPKTKVWLTKSSNRTKEVCSTTDRQVAIYWEEAGFKVVEVEVEL